MAGPDGLELSERSSCGCDRLGGAAGERPIPVPDIVGDERLVAERLAVASSAVAAALPDPVNVRRQDLIRSR